MINQPPPRATGWLVDPTGRFDERFTVGGDWTRRVRVGHFEAVDIVAIEADAPGPLAPWQRVPDGEWRDDPARRFEARWWDGRAWTRMVRHGEHVATDALAAPLAPRRRRRRRSAEDDDAPGWRPDPDGDGERYWDGWGWTAKHRTGPPSSSDNLQGWWSRQLLIGLIVLIVLVVGAIMAAVLALT